MEELWPMPAYYDFSNSLGLLSIFPTLHFSCLAGSILKDLLGFTSRQWLHNLKKLGMLCAYCMFSDSLGNTTSA